MSPYEQHSSAHAHFGSLQRARQGAVYAGLLACLPFAASAADPVSSEPIPVSE